MRRQATEHSRRRSRARGSRTSRPRAEIRAPRGRALERLQQGGASPQRCRAARLTSARLPLESRWGSRLRHRLRREAAGRARIRRTPLGRAARQERVDKRLSREPRPHRSRWYASRWAMMVLGQRAATPRCWMAGTFVAAGDDRRAGLAAIRVACREFSFSQRGGTRAHYALQLTRCGGGRRGARVTLAGAVGSARSIRGVGCAAICCASRSDCAARQD